ncbi:MAG: SUF system Fe-S cluster assembly regulator [Ferrovum sp.]|jgi:FeS assembly SUF system regulator|nr:SUF system Fe-S cluster assembly regulator [Ferrovum sp.]NDU87430.1 SUF system Fe-S cluster assembly regulator [Ferrovum sp.]
MIRIGKLTDYGILILTHMAQDGERLFTAHEVSHAVGVPLPTTTKLLKTLVKGQLLESHRGTKGGYLLARNPEMISMVDVVTALEGPVGLTDCGTSQQPGECRRSVSCAIKTNWQRINQAVHDALAQVTLAEMRLPAVHPVHLPAPRAASLRV